MSAYGAAVLGQLLFLGEPPGGQETATTMTRKSQAIRQQIQDPHFLPPPPPSYPQFRLHPFDPGFSMTNVGQANFNQYSPYKMEIGRASCRERV